MSFSGYAAILKRVTSDALGDWIVYEYDEYSKRFKAPYESSFFSPDLENEMPAGSGAPAVFINASDIGGKPKQGARVFVEMENQQYTIHSIEPDDSGSYICFLRIYR